MYAKMKLFIPLLIFMVLLGICWRQLFYGNTQVLPSALINQTVPTFQLPTLLSEQQMLTNKDFNGRVTLLNVWASWCYACAVEMPMLMRIKEQYHIPMYSINYRDDPAQAKAWLKQYGNPYVLVGSDTQGEAAIELGVYGTPELFIIDAQGKIIYRHIGVVDQAVWDNVLYPIIKKQQLL
ncbi:MAG TPA: DsbE family thiol:disulfide interchange protein [Gammaproteobacteria bacterium]|jgi:cytochrome c biogenesis protein CcmG/thiol:disulfide interchange protein DsbE|nr:DsbE family thiol:disulfide interchange protein [Gammaproteobacteria bacterium]